MAKANKGQRLIKNTFIVGIGSIASKGIIFLMAPLFSRWLSVEDYGSFDLVITYLSLILPVCTLSISESAFRFLLDNVDRRDKNEIITNGLFTSAIGHIAFLIVYGLISLVLPKLTFDWTICFLLFAQILFTYFCEVARGLKKVGIYSLYSLVSVVLLSSFSTVFLLVFKLGLSGIILGYGLGYLFASIGLFFATKSYRYISIKDLSFSCVKNMLKYSWPLIPNSISWWIVSLSDRLIINNYIGLAANGIYAVANKVPSIVKVGFSVFHVSWTQSASETVSDADYNEYCNKVFNQIIPFLFSTALFLISTNFLFYKYFFDLKYFDAYYYTPILIISIAVGSIGQFIGGIMIAKKETKLNGATNIIAAISNILINLLMVAKYGLYAASISTLLAYIIMVTCRLIMIHKYVTLKLSQNSIISIVLCIAVTLGVYLNNGILNVVLLAVSIPIFIIINKELIRMSIKMLAKRRQEKQ